MIEASNITVSRDNSCVTINCSGALDLTNSSQLQEDIAQASENADSLTVDMCAVMFIDTAVLSYLAHGAKIMLGRGKRLRIIVREKSQPHRVLETVGFSGLMDIDTVARPC